MSKQKSLILTSSFLPLPMFDDILYKGAYVYVGNPFFKSYYSAYSILIDKSYRLLHPDLDDDVGRGLRFAAIMQRKSIEDIISDHFQRYYLCVPVDKFYPSSHIIADMTPMPKTNRLYSTTHILRMSVEAMVPNGVVEFIDNRWKIFGEKTLQKLPYMDGNKKRMPKYKFRFS